MVKTLALVIKFNEKWLARPQFHFQSILDVNCKTKMQCLSILECSEANIMFECVYAPTCMQFYLSW